MILQLAKRDTPRGGLLIILQDKRQDKPLPIANVTTIQLGLGWLGLGLG